MAIFLPGGKDRRFFRQGDIVGYLRYEDSQSSATIKPWWEQYGVSLTEELRRIEGMGLPLEEKRALIVETKTKLFTETTTPEFRTAYQASIAADQAKIAKQLEEHEKDLARNKTLAIAATGAVGGLILLPSVLAPSTIAIADIPAGSTAAASGLPASTITGAAATTGGGLAGVIGSIGKVITGAVGGVVKAIPTIVNVLGSVSKVMTAKEQTKQREAELKLAEKAALVQSAQPGSDIGGQLSELLRGLFGAPAPATPPLIEPGSVQEAATVNWPLLGLLGVGTYLLLKRMR
jgi:hypothetical protein